MYIFLISDAVGLYEESKTETTVKPDGKMIPKLIAMNINSRLHSCKAARGTRPIQELKVKRSRISLPQT